MGTQCRKEVISGPQATFVSNMASTPSVVPVLWPSVCLVCLSHCGIASKNINESSRFRFRGYSGRILHCLRIFFYLQNKDTSLWNLFSNSDELSSFFPSVSSHLQDVSSHHVVVSAYSSTSQVDDTQRPPSFTTRRPWSVAESVARSLCDSRVYLYYLPSFT